MGDFPSGQRGQTVNLLQIASVVRIHHRPFRVRADLAGMAEPCETPEPLEGEIACVTPEPDEPLAGEPAPEEFELEGDVAWIPEDEAAPENGNG